MIKRYLASGAWRWMWNLNPRYISGGGNLGYAANSSDFFTDKLVLGSPSWRQFTISCDL